MTKNNKLPADRDGKGLKLQNRARKRDARSYNIELTSMDAQCRSIYIIMVFAVFLSHRDKEIRHGYKYG